MYAFIFVSNYTLPNYIEKSIQQFYTKTSNCDNLNDLFYTTFIVSNMRIFNWFILKETL